MGIYTHRFSQSKIIKILNLIRIHPEANIWKMAKIFAILIVSLMIGASLAQTPEDKWAQFKGRNGKLYKDKNEETRRYKN